MSRQYDIRNCPRCGMLVSVRRRTPNNILHLFMSIITCGIWLPIWILIIIDSSLSGLRVKCPKSCPRKRPAGRQGIRPEDWQGVA